MKNNDDDDHYDDDWFTSTQLSNVRIVEPTDTTQLIHKSTLELSRQFPSWESVLIFHVRDHSHKYSK